MKVMIQKVKFVEFRDCWKPVQTYLFSLFLSLSVLVGTLTAQSQPTTPAVPQKNPLLLQSKMMFQITKGWLTASAEKMPEEHYSFRPTEGVRTYGQIIGHLADQQYLYCAAARGNDKANLKGVNLKNEQTKTSKTELITALKEAFSYCDKTYEDLTDITALEIVNLGPTQFPRLGVLTINLTHSSLHYGNLITYMRMKKIVPPSTEMMEATQPKK